MSPKLSSRLLCKTCPATGSRHTWEAHAWSCCLQKRFTARPAGRGEEAWRGDCLLSCLAAVGHRTQPQRRMNRLLARECDGCSVLELIRSDSEGAVQSGPLCTTVVNVAAVTRTPTAETASAGPSALGLPEVPRSSGVGAPWPGHLPEGKGCWREALRGSVGEVSSMAGWCPGRFIAIHIKAFLAGAGGAQGSLVPGTSPADSNHRSAQPEPE